MSSMHETTAATVESSIKECDSHLSKCRRARGLLDPLFPLTLETFKNLKENEVEHIDQLIYRFTKMQDSMGTRLLPSLYSYIENDYSPTPFLNIISRLEQLSILSDAQT